MSCYVSISIFFITVSRGLPGGILEYRGFSHLLWNGPSHQKGRQVSSGFLKSSMAPEYLLAVATYFVIFNVIERKMGFVFQEVK